MVEIYKPFERGQINIFAVSFWKPANEHDSEALYLRKGFDPGIYNGEYALKHYNFLFRIRVIESLLVKFHMIPIYSESPLSHIICKENWTSSSGHRAWQCKQNMGWISAPLAPLVWHPWAVNYLHNCVKQPYVVYPKCQSTWNTCYVFPSSSLCSCSIFLLLSSKLAISQDLLMAKIMVNILKLILQTILWVRCYYHPFLPSEKKRKQNKVWDSLNYLPKVI